MKKIETKVADTILQRSQEVKIGEKTYQVTPPTTATLILISELVAQLPQVTLDATKELPESLRIAKDCRVLGDIVAVLILGATDPNKKQSPRPKWFTREKTAATQQRELAAEILYNMKPSELSELTRRLLQKMEIGYFFGFTVSLIEVNLTKATRETEEMTASGQ